MRKLLSTLFTIVILSLPSCSTLDTVMYGPNLEKLSRNLELGMTKAEVINVMGNDYYVESVSQTYEGKLEILHYRSRFYEDYLLYFVENSLSEFHRYTPPIQEVRVVEKENK